MDYDADTEEKLKANLVTFGKLEAKLRKKHNDGALFDRIELHRQSLRFYVNLKDFEKAIYESNVMAEFILPLLDD